MPGSERSRSSAWLSDQRGGLSRFAERTLSGPVRVPGSSTCSRPAGTTASRAASVSQRPVLRRGPPRPASHAASVSQRPRPASRARSTATAAATGRQLYAHLGCLTYGALISSPPLRVHDTVCHSCTVAQSPAVLRLPRTSQGTPRSSQTSVQNSTVPNLPICVKSGPESHWFHERKSISPRPGEKCIS